MLADNLIALQELDSSLGSTMDSTAAADSPTLGSESPDSMVRKTQQPRPKTPVTNFSRPRIYKTSSGKTYQEGDSNIKSVNAYYEQEDDDAHIEDLRRADVKIGSVVNRPRARTGNGSRFANRN